MDNSQMTQTLNTIILKLEKLEKTFKNRRDIR